MKQVYILLLFFTAYTLQSQTMTFDSGASESGFTFSGWNASGGTIYQSNLSSPSSITKDSGTWNLISFKVGPLLGNNNMQITSDKGDTYNYNTSSVATHTLNWTNITSISIQRLSGSGSSADYDNFVYTVVVPCTIDSGLIINGNAENGITGWTMESGTNWTTRSADPAPQNCQNYFFAGAGTSGQSSKVILSQVVDVSSYASNIDLVNQYFNFKGYVRSYNDDNGDTTQIIVEYRNSDGSVLTNFTSDIIQSKTSWQEVSNSRFAPAGTRSIKVSLISTKVPAGTNIDGYFDNISLTTVSCLKTAPYTYNVETATPTTNSSIEDCWASSNPGNENTFRWDVTGNGTTPSSSTGPDTAHSGTNYFYTEGSSGISGNTAGLFTPLIDVSTLTTPSLQFYYHMYGVNIEYTGLHIDIFNGTSWTLGAANILGQQHAAGTDDWSLAVIDLSSYVDSNNVIKVRFRVDKPSGGSLCDIALDDIAIVEMLSSSCSPPMLPTAKNIGTTSADLSWTTQGSATSWNIELVDITAGGTPTGTPTLSDVTNSYTITNLTPGNSYKYYVQSNCGTNNVSEWIGPFTFNTLSVGLTCNNTFVDPGGSSGAYLPNQYTEYTICPNNSGDQVSVTFTSFNMESSSTGCADWLRIHNGADDSMPIITTPNGEHVWCWDRDITTPSGTGDLQGMTITASNSSGCLTFVFYSDFFATRDGWEATISCSNTTLDSNNVADVTVFSYSPNPVENILTFNAQKSIQHITMYNILGQEVLKATPNAVNSELDMSNLQSGTYFVKITIANVSKTIKIIKK